MKAASGALIAHLNNSVQYKMADILAITGMNGFLAQNMYLSGSDFTIVDSAINYLPARDGSVLGFERTGTKISVGLEVDTMDITLYGVTNSYGNIPFQQFVANGGLDGARVQLRRAFMPDFGDFSFGSVWMFGGRIADVETSRNEIHITANSDVELLDVQYPRNIYQKGCMNTLFDSGCGVVRTTYAVTSTGTAGGTTTAVKITDAAATGYYDLGAIRCITGPNAGAKRTIKSFVAGTPGTVNLHIPLAYVPGTGDTWEVVPGCDKTKTGGCTKFGNTPRFRGCRFIPRPEAVR